MLWGVGYDLVVCCLGVGGLLLCAIVVCCCPWFAIGIDMLFDGLCPPFVVSSNGFFLSYGMYCLP